MTTANPNTRARASWLNQLTGTPLSRLLPMGRFVDRIRRAAQYKLFYLRHLRTRLSRRQRLAILAWLILSFLACDGLILGLPRVGYGAILLGAAVFGWQWAARPPSKTVTEATEATTPSEP